MRPIAVGEVLRRLTRKVLVQTFQRDAVEASLSPHQLRVGIAGATELTGPGASFHHAQGEHLLQVDLKNAYNRLNRARMLDEVRACTQLIPMG